MAGGAVRAATRCSCCRPAAASRCASRRPPIASDGLAIVVSPLISLMKDQVDTLVGNGVAAACYNSSMPSERKSEVARGVRDGQVSIALRRARAPGRRRRRRVPQHAVVAADQLHRRGRSALHQPVGTRLPSGVSPARAAARSLAGHRPACLHGHRDRARPAATSSSQLGLRNATELVGSFDRPEPGLSRAGAIVAEGADPRRARAASRPGRHHLLLVAQGRGRDRAVAAGHRLAGAAVSRRHGRRGAASQPGCVPQRRDRSDRRDGGVRDGHRSIGRALRDPRRRAAVARALPAGVGPRRPRRARSRVRADRVGRGLPEVAHDAREERRAVGRAPRPVARHRALRGQRRLPPQAPGQLFRRDVHEGRLRRVRLLPRRARKRRRAGHRRAQGPVRASRVSASASARRTSPTSCAAATASRSARAAITSCRCSA